ncbi:MAG: PQQ-like beta-propeller repeat protein [Gemmataceae bacterium]|nr:PQQ-like beta-propeller repeat protein [Gemmataceae bacterium]
MRPFALLVLFVAALPASAQLKEIPGEWPAWRGPNRDGQSKETGLLRSWPKDGPKLLWKINNLGEGYATPSVAQGKVFVVGTDKEKNETLFALNIKDGEVLWSTPFGKLAGGYPGPRSTPTIDGDRAYVLSSDGKLLCANVADGSVVWKKDIKKDFNGRFGGWANTESPLVDGDRVLVTPGGETAPIVALKKADGSLIWKADLTGLPENGGKKKGGNYTTAGYSSILAANLAGTKQYVQFLSGGVVGLRASDGKLLWHYEHPANKTANISTPVIVGNDEVFAASAYSTGGGLAKIETSGDGMEAKERYFLDEFQNHHGGMIAHNGFLYGTNGGALLCLDLKSGKFAWKAPGKESVGKGSIFLADGLIFHRSERGPIALVEANPTKYVELGRFTQPERSDKNAWAHPVVAGGRLYIRDQGLLLCYDVKQ